MTKPRGLGRGLDALLGGTLVPPQSYFDVETAEFNRSLLFSDEPYPDFSYHGRNSYAALPALAGPDIFDLVDIQLYESYSRAKAAIDVSSFFFPLASPSFAKRIKNKLVDLTK